MRAQWGTGAKPWESYASAVNEWTEFLAEHGVGLFGSSSMRWDAVAELALSPGRDQRRGQ
jgi:hypothetical protein